VPDKCHGLSGAGVVGTVGMGRPHREARGRSGRLIGGGATLYCAEARKCLFCSQSPIVSQLKSFQSYPNLRAVLHPFEFAPYWKYRYSTS
jgi:hypothetical protein